MNTSMHLYEKIKQIVFSIDISQLLKFNLSLKVQIAHTVNGQAGVIPLTHTHRTYVGGSKYDIEYTQPAAKHTYTPSTADGYTERRKKLFCKLLLCQKQIRMVRTYCCVIEL